MADTRVFGDIATKLLFENDRVRIWEMRLAPGEKSALHKPGGKILTYPVLRDGKLYLRDQELIFCYQVK